MFYGNYVYRNMEEKTVKYGVSPTFSDFSKNQTGELIVVEEKQDHDVMSLLGRKVEFKTFLHVPNPESQYISWVSFLMGSWNAPTIKETTTYAMKLQPGVQSWLNVYIYF